jgi:hypothetical protein
MDWVRLLLDKLLTWPVVVLVAVAAFRRPLTALLAREWRLGLGKEGVTFATAAVAIQAEGHVPSVLPDTESAKRLLAVENVNVAPIVLEQEKLIRVDLEKLAVSQPDQVRLLIKHLAMTQLRLRAEFTYRTIFGSQIALLKSLNTSGPRSRADLLQFYEQAKERSPDLYGSYSFEQYLHYLLSSQLVTQEDVDLYTVTGAAREFLKWITDTGLTENKPF